MHRIFGLILAGGLVLASAATADAQLGISIGNPYAGQGLTIGTPGYGYPNYTNGYNSYYPGGYSYTSGYSGYSGVYPGGYGYTSAYARPYAYAAPAYGYRAYGYRPYYGYGARRMWRPFRRW